MKKTYYLIAYGCQMNYSVVNKLRLFGKNRYSPVSDKNKTDLIVINVYSVQQSAIDQVYGPNSEILLNLKLKIQS